MPLFVPAARSWGLSTSVAYNSHRVSSLQWAEACDQPEPGEEKAGNLGSQQPSLGHGAQSLRCCRIGLHGSLLRFQPHGQNVLKYQEGHQAWRPLQVGAETQRLPSTAHRTQPGPNSHRICQTSLVLHLWGGGRQYGLGHGDVP